MQTCSVHYGVARYYRRVYDQVERASANGRAMQGSMFWTWHHEDLRSVALPIDDYAIFLGDPVFADMRRHASVMRGGVTPQSLRACGRFNGSSGVDAGEISSVVNVDDVGEAGPSGERIFGLLTAGGGGGGNGGGGSGLIDRMRRPCLFGTFFC